MTRYKQLCGVVRTATVLLLIVTLTLSNARTSFAATAQDTETTLSVNGVSRAYLLHVPPSSLVTGTPVPLVLVLHGVSGDGADVAIAQLTNMNATADQYGFAVAYPNARTLPNCAFPCTKWDIENAAGSNDVAFIIALIDALVQRGVADTNHVYVAGFSNGGDFAHELACEHPGRIMGIAAVGANLPKSVAASCVGMDMGSAVSMLAINGTEDTTQGQRVEGSLNRSWNGTRDFWLARNHCDPAMVTESALPNTDPLDGTTATARIWSCAMGQAVEQIIVQGGGHAWPGSAEPDAEKATCTEHSTCISQDFSANAVIWQFFAALTR